MKKTIAVVLGLAFAAGASNAGPSYKKEVVPVDPLFRSGEFQLDLFGAYATGNVDYSDETKTKIKTHRETRVRELGPVAIDNPGDDNENEQPAATETTIEDGVVVKRTTKTVKEKKTTRYKDRVHNAAGGGVGLNYFFCPYAGIGIEGDWIWGDSCIHIVSASLIARLPIENESHTFGVAPYIYTGGGGQFDGQNVGFWHIGAGAEARFSRMFGVFADGRYVLHDSDIQYGLFRLGARVIF